MAPKYIMINLRFRVVEQKGVETVRYALLRTAGFLQLWRKAQVKAFPSKLVLASRVYLWRRNARIFHGVAHEDHLTFPIRKIKKKLIIFSRLTTLITLFQQFKSF
jgi:hypothetical protein